MVENQTSKPPVRLIRGDIVDQKVDAIVNAANTTLLGGGGVDGAIHRAAGPELLKECRAIGGCPTGEARLTRGYDLRAAHVIHTVGPVFRDGRHGEPEKLQAAYESSLALALKHRLRSIAFPSISTGAYRFPINEAARIALETVNQWLATHDFPEEIVFVLFSDSDLKIYQQTQSQLS